MGISLCLAKSIISFSSVYVIEEFSRPSVETINSLIKPSLVERALNPSEKERGSYHQEDIEPFQNSPQLNVLDGPSELFPGLDLLISNGHTTGLEMVRIQDGSTTLFFCGDLMPTASHLPLPYIMGFDVYPLTTVEEKRTYLKQACQEDWLIALQHDPNYEAIRIRQGDKYFEFSESINFCRCKI